jgi:UDP-N-acetyl-D-glucosamine dehydrogenase
MVKLLENTFRAVNIGLANEMALVCDCLGLNVWEVAAAAATKPYGFTSFLPGPGLGGHCIPVDPLYLSWKLRGANFEARFISLADDINSHMPHYVVDKIADALNEARKPVRESRLLILGVAYKRDIGDVRESPALDIIESLLHKGAEVAYHDPYVPEVRVADRSLRPVELTAGTLQFSDCVVVVTDHSSYDWAWIAEHASLIVDTRNALGAVADPRARVVRI